MENRVNDSIELIKTQTNPGQAEAAEGGGAKCPP